MSRLAIIAGILMAQALSAAIGDGSYEYRVLGTTKTSTMEKEMNEAASAGFDFRSVMGGDTAFGGKEVVVVMGREPGRPPVKKEYKLLATNKTSTLEKEMQAAAQAGYEYKGQTVFESAFGGREVSIIMERDTAIESAGSQYKLIATSKTSTMEKELGELGAAGYSLLGMTVSKTAFGGNEVVCIMRRAR